MKKSLSLLLLTIASFFVQAQDATALLKYYFGEVREGRYPPIPKQFSLPEYADKTLKGVQVYAADSAARVRAKSYGMLRYVGMQSRQPGIRERAVEQLVQGGEDKDAGNVGTVFQYLSEFHANDFTNKAKEKLKTTYQRHGPHFSSLLRLLGAIQLTELKESIRTYTLSGNQADERWAAIVALARMGDADATEEMMRRATKLPVNDDVVYEVFPDLIYSRQRVGIEYLVKVLDDDAKNCISSGEDEHPIACGYRIMEQLAPIIEGYPLTIDASGDIHTDDYKQALATVRDWFHQHQDFKIVQR